MRISDWSSDVCSSDLMWDSRASGCLAGQLTNFINQRGITDLVVITHSNGGNIMRWILSNPTWDARYPNIISKTRWVNALAPSSAGTPLADAVMNGNIFESAVGWLLGFKTDAVRQQQVSWMAYRSEEHTSELQSLMRISYAVFC